MTEAQARGFRRYVEPEIEVLLRVASTLTGPSDAEDLVQETLVRAWRSVERFDGRHPRAWLLTILRNTNMNMHRRRRPGTVADIAELGAVRPAFGADPPGTEEEVMTSFLSDDLERAVQSLDPKFRTVLLLIDVDQLTYGEASKVLGVPVGTVMSRLSRARARVRRHLRPTFVAASRKGTS
ncbi:MAG: sigma-70 family RNA polymerase sigma factor [Mycobacterium sp.]|nr:sigma-70 family RNA polymerase sigma factor [Mycobacterium sp.]